MKGLWRIAIVVAAVLALGGAAVGFVAAQTDEGSATTQAERPDFAARLAENLGITLEEFQAAVQQTQLDIVAEKLASGEITEEQAAQIRERIESGEGRFGPGHDRPGHDRPGHNGCQRLVYQVSEIIGVPAGDVVSALEQGHSLAQIAEANGVPPAELMAALLSNLQEHLARAVEAGKIDQARADEMLANAAAEIERVINHEGPLPCQRPHRPSPDGGLRFPGAGEDSPAPAPSLSEL